MVDTLTTLKPGNIIVAGDLIFKIAKMGPVQTKADGGFTYETANVRTVPPGFAGGELEVSSYGSKRLACFLKGNFDRYRAGLPSGRYDRYVDLTCAAVGEGEWMKPYDVAGLTKLDLMSYVIAVHGPSTREDIMRRVAALESLPWIPTSNNEYFSNVRDEAGSHKFYGKAKDNTLALAGKNGRKQLYGLGPLGQERAKAALARLGEGPAREVK